MLMIFVCKLHCKRVPGAVVHVSILIKQHFKEVFDVCVISCSTFCILMDEWDSTYMG